MLLTRAGRLVLPAGVVLVIGSQFLCASDLHLRAVEGQAMVVAPGVSSSRRIVVAVENDQGKPLAGATVRFRLPAEGSTGRFASGMITETVLSGPDGRASVFGIVWNGQPGPLVVAVACSFGTETAEVEIPIEIGQRSQKELNTPNPGHFPSAGSNRKWLVLAAVIVGGAAVGAA
ncbi:MAG: hypothetical protein ABSC08_11370, partial [Bryobacteraceae bacterium]